MCHICKQIVGDNLIGEMASFYFLSLLVVASSFGLFVHIALKVLQQ